MKKGQKLLVVSPCLSRSSLSCQTWSFTGEIMKKCYKNGYGQVITLINFPDSALKKTRAGFSEFYFNGITLVKIEYSSKNKSSDYGVGLFWTEHFSLNENEWGQRGYICLLSDINAKRELRSFYKRLTEMGVII